MKSERVIRELLEGILELMFVISLIGRDVLFFGKKKK